MEIGPLSAYLPMVHHYALARRQGSILLFAHSLPNSAVVLFSIQPVEPAADRQVRCLPRPPGMAAGLDEVAVGPATGSLVS